MAKSVEKCPKCGGSKTHIDFLNNHQCEDCFTVWGKWGISEGEAFDDEPDMCTDFEEFSKRAEGDRNG